MSKTRDTITESRDELFRICDQYFEDKTFHNYIINPLAGDFAFEIVNTIKQLEAEKAELIDALMDFHDNTNSNGDISIFSALDRTVKIIQKYNKEE